MTPTLLGTVGVYISAVLSTIGLISFTVLARFRRSRGGWFVFTDMLIIAWVLDLATISHLFDPAWLVWLRVVTFTFGFPILLVWRLVIIFDLQVERRSDDPEAYRASRPTEEEVGP